MNHTCSKCDSVWGGLNTAHCTACHHTFSGITAFDKHRTGSHVTGRYCLTPTEVGLVDSGRAYPCWGFPGGDEHWSAAS